jgi:hypothetical protein
VEQAQYLTAVLQQQRNQALDALAAALAQLNAMRDQLALAQAEVERLSSARKMSFDRGFEDGFGDQH